MSDAALFSIDAARLFPIEEGSDAWYTPRWVFDGLGVVFDLDVASPAGGLPWLPARAHYSVSDDGLAQPWHGLVWCNPPYSDPAPWCRRWSTHPEGFLLIRADLSSSGPFAAVDSASSLYCPPKRLQFVSGSGETTGSANFSVVILSRGERADAALCRLAATSGGLTRRLR